jgi:hypothetical protein
MCRNIHRRRLAVSTRLTNVVSLCHGTKGSLSNLQSMIEVHGVPPQVQIHVILKLLDLHRGPALDSRKELHAHATERTFDLACFPIL